MTTIHRSSSRISLTFIFDVTITMHSEGIWGLMIAWVTVGHLGVTVGHFRATAGHLRVIKGPLRVRN